MVFSLEIFWAYLIGTKVMIFIDHTSLRYIFNKKGVENVVADHLSQLENKDVTQKEKDTTKEFSNEYMMGIREWTLFSDMTNYKVTKKCSGRQHLVVE